MMVLIRERHILIWQLNLFSKISLLQFIRYQLMLNYFPRSGKLSSIVYRERFKHVMIPSWFHFYWERIVLSRGLILILKFAQEKAYHLVTVHGPIPDIM